MAAVDYVKNIDLFIFFFRNKKKRSDGFFGVVKFLLLWFVYSFSLIVDICFVLCCFGGD
jgi:hypothetical protein